jgi:peptidyl-prolyl cis-trans isomerase C
MEAEARGLEDDPGVRHRLASAREHILGNALMDAVVAERVDEPAIRKMYDAQIEAQVQAGQLGEEARVRHIVVGARDAIDRVVADLRAGEDFSVLASQRSTDESTKLEGGDLGFMSDQDAANLSPELAQAIKATPTGSVSRPFQTGLGWHVIRVDERRREQPPSIEELREPILQFMRTEQIDETLKQLRSEARIDRKGAPRDAPLDTDPFRLAPTEPDAPRPARPAAPVQAQGKRPPAETSAAAPPADPPATTPAPAAPPASTGAQPGDAAP